MSDQRTERGNAIALTLLGLAVAILAGVGMLYVLGQNTPTPTTQNIEEGVQDEVVPSQASIDPRNGWNTYTNDTYGFSFSFPPGWIVATGTERGAPVITVYDARQTQGSTSTETIGVHDLPYRVSMYPEGLPGGGEGEETVPSENLVLVSQAHSVDYVLSTGVPWATKTVFDQHPDSWASYGYVYGRVPIEEEQVAYLRGDTPIQSDEFDPYTGDTMSISGYTDALAWNTMGLILSSFHFDEIPRAGEGSQLQPVIVSTPKAGEVVSSPLLVEGEARGSWYFEASFPVELVADDGEVLATIPATALDDWMTEEYVPFSVSIVFEAPTQATSGLLIFKKDNPSGMQENDASLSIPVLFEY